MRSLVLVFGAGAMISQVLILRELLVLAQGQELKLALGLWCWLLWVRVGQPGGRASTSARGPRGGAGPAGRVAGAPGAAVARHHPGEPLPSQSGAPAPGPIPAAVHHLPALFTPAGPLRVGFRLLFPQRSSGPVLAYLPKGPSGGPTIWRPWARPWGWRCCSFLVGRYANLSLGLAVGLGLALAPWLLARPRSPAARAALTLNLSGVGRGPPVRSPVGAASAAAGSGPGGR